MAKENKTKYAILGVLNLMPASGYDIKKFCDNSISHFWSENYGHIYPVLKQMEADGLVEKATEINDGKLRNVFSITETGRERLVEWLSVPSEVPPVRYEFLLKIFFSKDIPKETLLDRMKESEAFCSALLKSYQKIEESLRSKIEDCTAAGRGAPYWYLTLRYGVLDMEAKVRWCQESIKLIQTL